MEDSTDAAKQPECKLLLALSSVVGARPVTAISCSAALLLPPSLIFGCFPTSFCNSLFLHVKTLPPGLFEGLPSSHTIFWSFDAEDKVVSFFARNPVFFQCSIWVACSVGHSCHPGGLTPTHWHPLACPSHCWMDCHPMRSL